MPKKASIGEDGLTLDERRSQLEDFLFQTDREDHRAALHEDSSDDESSEDEEDSEKMEAVFDELSYKKELTVRKFLSPC